MTMDISKKQFRKLCERAIYYGFCYCYLCGEPIVKGDKWNLDHIRPRAKGGLTVPDNLRPVHVDCNQAKKDMYLGEYRQIQQIILKQTGRSK
mgnify:CR=1 FL=1